MNETLYNKFSSFHTYLQAEYKKETAESDIVEVYTGKEDPEKESNPNFILFNIIQNLMTTAYSQYEPTNSLLYLFLLIHIASKLPYSFILKTLAPQKYNELFPQDITLESYVKNSESTLIKIVEKLITQFQKPQTTNIINGQPPSKLPPMFLHVLFREKVENVQIDTYEHTLLFLPKNLHSSGGVPRYPLWPLRRNTPTWMSVHNMQAHNWEFDFDSYTTFLAKNDNKNFGLV